MVLPSRRLPRVVGFCLFALAVIVYTFHRSELELPPSLRYLASQENAAPIRPSKPDRWAAVQNQVLPKSMHTQIRRHATGWTVFDNLYVHGGTIYIVTDDPASVPERRMMISTGYPWVENNNDEHDRMREPTDKELQIIDPSVAYHAFFGTVEPLIVEGTTFMSYDHHQYVAHYYHFVAEILLGWWRMYSALDPDITSDGSTILTDPRRLMFPHVEHDRFRDSPGMNKRILHAAFPSASIEYSRDWLDRAATGHTYVLERVVLFDRMASFRGKIQNLTARSPAEAMSVPASKYWWDPMRNRIVKSSGFDMSLWNLPKKNEPVWITYVSRQKASTRHFKYEDHIRLSEALKGLEGSHNVKVEVVELEHMNKDQQIQQFAKSTIVVSPHGNGLTGLLWMKPNPRSMVIECFYPNNFLNDYEWTTHALGMKHVVWWGKQHFVKPNIPKRNGDQNLQSTEIPIDVTGIVKVVIDQLNQDTAMRQIPE